MNHSRKQFLVLLIGMIVMGSAEAAYEKKELWVPVEPMDHKRTEEAVSKAVAESGAAGVAENVQPFSRRLDESGIFPQDYYFFVIACDLKLYANLHQPPAGQRKLLAVGLTRVKDYWVARASISYRNGNNEILDDGIVGKKPAEIKRWDHFQNPDPQRAALEVLRDLQEQGKIFNPSKPIPLPKGCGQGE